MYLNRDNIEKITEILEKFSEVNTFEIKSDTSSGIGPITTIVFETTVNGVTGNFEIEISGIEHW